MSIKVVKAVQDVGRADDGGVDFTHTHLMEQVRVAYFAAQKEATKQDMPITGPARVKVLVEQDVIEK